MFYSALALASGSAFVAFVGFLDRKVGFKTAFCMSIAIAAVVLLATTREVAASLKYRVLSRDPFLSSRPPPHLTWIVNQVKEQLKPGERLLYEEGGFGLPGVPDPFQNGRYSGLLPQLTGVEVLGGPYLHASLKTNHTQFGEGLLFGKARWGREDFIKAAMMYRPSAILCWSPWARNFCKANPDLIEIIGEHGKVLFGRVKGYEGSTIRGKAGVVAEPGRLFVSNLAAELDGLTVLRYHHAPGLFCRPEHGLVPVWIDGDPVPFIGLENGDGPFVIELSPYRNRAKPPRPAAGTPIPNGN